MNKLIRLAEKIVENIEESNINIFVWLGTFWGIIIVRIVVDSWVSGLQEPASALYLYDFFDSFSIAALLLLFVFKVVLKVDFKKAANVLLWGYLLIIFPPVINLIVSRGNTYLSFYIFDSLGGLIRRYFTFFGDRPDFGVTYGIRVQILLAAVLFFIYGFLKTRTIWKSFLAALLTYSIFFFFGTFPSWIAIAVRGFSEGFLKVNNIDVAQMFLSPFSLFSREINNLTDALIVKVSLNYLLILSGVLLVGLFIYQKEKFMAFLKNIRPIQIIFHCGLFLAGIGLGLNVNGGGILFFNYFNVLGLLIILEAIILSWLASVVVNDIADEKIDAIANSDRPLLKKVFTLGEYKTLGWFLLGFAIFISFFVNPKVAFLLLAYQAITYFYSSWPFRLKRFAFLSTFVSSIALIMIFFSGYILTSSGENLIGLSWRIVCLLILAYTLSLGVKDFKDIEGDRKDNVYTIPVVFGENWAKIIVGGGIFLSFVLSVILLNEPRLFWWALLFGSISFWLVDRMSAQGEKKGPKNEPVNYQNIIWWLMGIVTVYGIILAKIVFL